MLEINTDEELQNLATIEKNNIDNCSKQAIYSLSTLMVLFYKSSFLIDNFVTTTKDLQNNIKVCAVFLYLQHYVSLNKPPEKLNIIIRPLLASLTNEKYTFFVEKASLSLFTLSVLFEKKNPSPIPKVIKNVINSLQEPNKNENNKNKKNNENVMFFFSKKAQGVNSFISRLIEKYKEETFNKHSCIMQTVFSEIDVFDKSYTEQNFEKMVETLNFNGLLQNLRIIKALVSESFLNEMIFSTLDGILNKMIKFIRFFNLLEKNYVPNLDTFMEENILTLEENKQSKHFIYKKIHKKLIQIFKNLIIALSSKILLERKNEKDNGNSKLEGYFIGLIEKICLLLKEENSLIYELISGFETFQKIHYYFIIF